jgi:hypothetical protein
MPTKIIDIPNRDTIEVAYAASRLDPQNRVTGHGLTAADMLAALMFATAPEFANDPRRHYLDDDRVAYIERTLKEAGIDIDRSIAVALGRQDVAA